MFATQCEIIELGVGVGLAGVVMWLPAEAMGRLQISEVVFNCSNHFIFRKLYQ